MTFELPSSGWFKVYVSGQENRAGDGLGTRLIDLKINGLFAGL